MRLRVMRMLCLCLVLLALLPLSSCKGESEPTLTVTVMDVGQSECILLSQGEHTLLVDTGTAAQRDAVLASLTHHRVRSLDYLLVTHPHEDHFGNARAVLETHTVGALLLSPAASEELGYSILLESAVSEGVPMQTVSDAYTFMLGEATCEVLCLMPQAEEANNTSLVLRVRFGEQVLLFMGDAEAEAEELLLSSAGESFVDCDFLKVGHHGSDTASTAAFVKAATPQYAVISCGKDNDYGFPHSAVLENLDAVGAAVYRTDTRGELQFSCDGKEIRYVEH